MSSFAERLPILDNPRADRVRRVSGLVGRSARIRSGLMLVEGPQAVRELVRHRPRTLRDVYVREDLWDSSPELIASARAATRWVHPVSQAVSAALSSDAQGVCAVASLDALRRELPDAEVGETLVVIAQGRDPGNVGTIIRTADAFGARAVIAVAGTVDAASPKVVRSSAGSVFHLPVCLVPSFAEARDLIHGRGAEAADPWIWRTSSSRGSPRARVCLSLTPGRLATRPGACLPRRCAPATASSPSR